MGPIVPTAGGFALVKLGGVGGSPFKGRVGAGFGLSPVRSSHSTLYAPAAGSLLSVSESRSGGSSADGTHATAVAAGGCATCHHPVTSSPSTSPVRRARETVNRSVDEDEEEDYGDEETKEEGGGRLRDSRQEGRAAAASVPVSARSSSSTSSGTAPMCCRNCGSMEVVKKASRFKKRKMIARVLLCIFFLYVVV